MALFDLKDMMKDAVKIEVKDAVRLEVKDGDVLVMSTDAFMSEAEVKKSQYGLASVFEPLRVKVIIVCGGRVNFAVLHGENHE